MSHNVKRGSYKKYLYDSKFKMPRSTQTLINSKKKKLESELLKQKQSTNAQLGIVNHSSTYGIELTDFL